jgi:hypothetical protein
MADREKIIQHGRAMMFKHEAFIAIDELNRAYERCSLVLGNIGKDYCKDGLDQVRTGITKIWESHDNELDK